MRRFLALAAVTTALALSGCAPETPDETVTSATDDAPLPGSTYAATGTPTIDLLDASAWGAEHLPAPMSGRSGELMHAGEEESATFTAVDGGFTLQLVCLADAATSLTVTVAADSGTSETLDAPCATGVGAQPELFSHTADDGETFTVTIAATVDTLVALQQAAAN